MHKQKENPTLSNVLGMRDFLGLAALELEDFLCATSRQGLRDASGQDLPEELPPKGSKRKAEGLPKQPKAKARARLRHSEAGAVPLSDDPSGLDRIPFTHGLTALGNGPEDDGVIGLSGKSTLMPSGRLMHPGIYGTEVRAAEQGGGLWMADIIIPKGTMLSLQLLFISLGEPRGILSSPECIIMLTWERLEHHCRPFLPPFDHEHCAVFLYDLHPLLSSKRVSLSDKLS
jgi:hypothetical protein